MVNRHAHSQYTHAHEILKEKKKKETAPSIGTQCKDKGVKETQVTLLHCRSKNHR
jgi:hypothetical protein